ncbi:hypothetical protein ACFQ3C_10105 [Seohaeicola saemankumensis]|uniref:Uncharacterized protein n=1 Tax=Seohaeicola saemankumensis TaxID=481181 RepID=A0ABW3TCX1_9RHOB
MTDSIRQAPHRRALSRPLRDSVSHSIPLAMRRIFDMDDRARLRERFFGASLTVLARL